MNTQSTPVITAMQVVPVAGYDSMLLNIGGTQCQFYPQHCDTDGQCGSYRAG